VSSDIPETSISDTGPSDIVLMRADFAFFLDLSLRGQGPALEKRQSLRARRLRRSSRAQFASLVARVVAEMSIQQMLWGNAKAVFPDGCSIVTAAHSEKGLPGTGLVESLRDQIPNNRQI
jgi:hypothetical protein